MPTDIGGLRGLMERATPGEWRVIGDHWIDDNCLDKVAGNFDWEDGGIVRPEDAALIVAAHNALPALLDEIERLRAEVAAFVRERDDADAEAQHAGFVAGTAADDAIRWLTEDRDRLRAVAEAARAYRDAREAQRFARFEDFDATAERVRVTWNALVTALAALDAGVKP